MTNQYTAATQRLVDAVFNTPGDTDSALRRAVAEWTASPGLQPSESIADKVSPALRTYVNKVALHAYKVTDADVEALRKAGYSEDALFEITVSVALAAGLARLERGLAVLRGEEDQ